MTTPRFETKIGQPSWLVKNGRVEAWISRKGGMVAPANFSLPGGRKASPFAVAPWAENINAPGLPPLLQALRGDFLCAPFGGNEGRWKGESHPPHGESANSDWEFVDFSRNRGDVSLRLRLETRARHGVIEKEIHLRKEHTAIYTEHRLSGYTGSMPVGIHPCLAFPPDAGEARISVGGWQWGQVLPTPFEDPARGGYSSLKPGAVFASLDSVPMLDGQSADLSRYPAREGFDDLVMLMGAASKPDIGWSAVTFPRQRWAYIQLKDSTVLRHTILWHSNGGRHYTPWNGEHRRVLGIEETTSYFHFGLAESCRGNPLSAKGIPTTLKLSKKKPLRIAHIIAVVALPHGFDIVRELKAVTGGVELIAANGKRAKATLDTEYLSERTP